MKFARVALCLCLLAWLPHGSRAFGEDRQSVLFPAGDEYQVLWQRIETARESQNWDAVLEGLTQFAELARQPEVNSVIPSGGGIAVGIRRLLAGVVARLPAEPLSRCAKRLDPILKGIWEESRLEDRRRVRHRLLRDYRGTNTYVAALNEEIDEAFEEGSWGTARVACEQLLAMADSRGKEQGLEERFRAHVLLAEISRIQGDAPSAERHRGAVQSLSQGGNLDRLEPPLKSFAERWLRAGGERGPERPPPPPTAGEFHGNALEPSPPQDVANEARAFRVGTVAWALPLPNSRLRRFVEERSEKTTASSVPLPYHPVAHDGWLYFQESGRIAAYDTRQRRQVWSVTFQSHVQDFGEIRAPLVDGSTCYDVEGQAISAFCRSDGAFLWKKSFDYDRDGKKLRQSFDFWKEPPEVKQPPAESGAEKPKEGDAAEEDVEVTEEPEEEEEAPGERRAGREEKPPLPVLVSLSPAAFSQNHVVVAVSVRIVEECLVYLTCLSGEGDEIWTTFLGSSQGGNHLGLGGAGSPPMPRDGEIFHLTNLGFLAAVDAFDGTILWLSQYPGLNARGKREAIQTENRWQPNPILQVGEALIVAPQDSAYLFSFSRETGEILWRTEREGGSSLVGATEDACFIAGREVVALGHSGQARGKVLWRFDLSRAQSGESREDSKSRRAFGRPLLTPGALLVPCHDSLVRISPQDGKLLSRTLWEFAGGSGNLSLCGQTLGIINPEGFLAYNDLETERGRVESRPANDAEALLTRARLCWKNLDLASGIEALETWASGSPPAPAPNSRLDHLQLDLAEMAHHLSQMPEGKEFARDLLGYRVRLERTPERKVAATIHLAERLEGEGDLRGALRALHAGLVEDNPATEYSPLPFLSVPSAAYIRERIASVRARASGSRDIVASIDDAADEALKLARKRGTPSAYMDLLRLYPHTPAAAQGYIELSRCLEERKNPEQAIRALDGYLRDYPDGKESTRVKLLMARLLSESGRTARAREICLELLKAQSPVEGPEKGTTIEQEAEALWKELALAEAPSGTPFKFPVCMAWRSPADLQATHRFFLTPAVEAPEALKDCFFTQSVEVLECRSIDTGLPLWTVQMEMIPGFELDDGVAGFRFPRTGPRSISGRYVGSLLVLHDELNVFALDPIKGIVRWHVPLGSQSGAKSPGSSTLRQLKERLRGVAISDEGVFLVSSGKERRRQLRKLNLEGETAWETDIDYEPAAWPCLPTVFGKTLFVHSLRPLSIFLHDVSDGKLLGEVGRGEIQDQRVGAPIQLSGNRLLLGFRKDLKLLDLETREFLWSYSKPRSTIEDVAYFPEFPDECLLRLNRPNNWPAVVCVSLKDGSETWRHEKFPARRGTSFSFLREENRVYISHGEEDRQILALQVRHPEGSEKPVVEPLWPKEVSLGNEVGGDAQEKILVGQDSLMVFSGDPYNSVSIYDKWQGTSRNAAMGPISKFLVEKGNVAATILKGKLVIVTDGGDCAFEALPLEPTVLTEGADVKLLRQYMSKPSDFSKELALGYLREGRLEPAIQVVNRALLSADLLEENMGEKRFLLSYILDGLKQEQMKEKVPEVVSQRFLNPPAIDGELNDPWDIGTRIHMNTPVNIGTIPGPTQRRDWDGEEDLSAILYTGWDDQYFYFALDVKDDAIYPYDRDAENWKGDCLLIGLDPTGDGGYRQHGNDQLMTLALTVPKRNKLEKDQKEKQDGEEEEEEGDERKPDGLFSVKKKEDDSGAVYEVGLPWYTFARAFRDKAPPSRGYSFGLSLLLTDDDTGQAATKTLSLNPCHILPRNQKDAWVWRFVIPYFFPRVKLE